jgi:fucose permease
MIDSGVNTYVADYASARLMNWLHAAFGVGATIGPFMMTKLFDEGIRWQWGFGIVGVVQLAMIPLMLWTLARWRYVSVDEDDEADVRAPLRSTLLMPAALIGIVTFAVYAGLEISAGNWSYTLFTEGRGIDETLAGWVIGIYWGSFTVGRILFGFVGNRWSEALVVRTAIGALIVGSILVWVDLANALTFAGLTLIGIACAPIFPLLINNTAARLSKRHAANAIGLQIAAAGFGGAVLPGAIGVTAENIGLETIGPWLLAMSAGMLVLHEALISITVRRQRTEALAHAPTAKLPGD